MTTSPLSRTESFVRIIAAYVVALVVGVAWLWWGPAAAWLWLDALIANVLATLVVFVASRLHHNSSFYDAYWSVVPPLLMLFWWLESPAGLGEPRLWLVATVVVFWAVRLTGNWAYTFPGLHHEDWRYPMLRERAGRWELLVDLVAIHLVPTLLVFGATLPVYVAVVRTDRDLGWLDLIALLVGIGSVILSLVADTQMHRFVRVREPGQVMDRGLWGWSRHPNYLGEIGFWFSLALFGLAASPADAWWIFAGAVAMLVLFLTASIPMMEQRSLERRPGYQDVVNRVPRLMLRPPRRATG
ncbi:DUF1295 domain-containing protein [Nocardioides sp.]|uniref:DUF1295 domain-containing protein n=1 Tax=Nocardioides sp. TaxID=35761 RepID=UPI0027358A95|nr:DUF1295 domain-containing protein [Nocardioides sp.]MDP3890746.1 DUF1295 domain-containing protein [Nocardioides sp.]